MYPQLHSDLDRRRRSAKRVLAFIDATMHVKPSDWRFAATTLEVAFRSVAGESTRDWFTLADHLGQPSRALAHEIYENLKELKELDPRSKAAGHILGQMDELAFPDMLQNFRETTSQDEPRPTDIREGWCHVLWSHNMPDRALVGAVHGTPLEVVSVLNRWTPGTCYGVLAAWHVEDPDWAAAQIVRTFGQPLDQLGLMPVPASGGLPRMKLLTENAIWKTIVKSPWHVEAAEPSHDDVACADQHGAVEPTR